MIKSINRFKGSLLLLLAIVGAASVAAAQPSAGMMPGSTNSMMGMCPGGQTCMMMESMMGNCPANKTCLMMQPMMGMCPANATCMMTEPMKGTCPANRMCMMMESMMGTCPANKTCMIVQPMTACPAGETCYVVEQIQNTSSAQTRLDCARFWLEEAMKLHDVHIRDPSTATNESQIELMDQIANAYNCVIGKNATLLAAEVQEMNSSANDIHGH